MPHMVHSATTTAQDLESPGQDRAGTTPAEPHASQPDSVPAAYEPTSVGTCGTKRDRERAKAERDRLWPTGPPWARTDRNGTSCTAEPGRLQIEAKRDDPRV
jgi:hypothetical protein